MKKINCELFSHN